MRGTRREVENGGGGGAGRRGVWGEVEGSAGVERAWLPLPAVTSATLCAGWLLLLLGG